MRIKSLVLTLTVVVMLLAGCGAQAPKETGPTEISLNIGATAQTSKITVTVLEANLVKNYDYYSLVWKENRVKDAPEGYLFLIAKVEIENVSSETLNVGSNNMYASHSEFPKDPMSPGASPEPYFGEEPLKGNTPIGPGEKINGMILFHIPKTATDLKIGYSFHSLKIHLKIAEWAIKQ